MKMFLRSTSILILVAACSHYNSAGIAVMPEPPEHPALKRPELMDPQDKARLADFYRSYEVYLKKLKAWKKAFK